MTAGAGVIRSEVSGFVYFIQSGDRPLVKIGWAADPKARLKSYGYRDGDELQPLKIPAGHLEWLAALPITHEDEQRIFVHAGVPFDQPLSEASPRTLQWMLYPGDVEHGAAEFHPDAGHLSGKHIVHGHHQSAAHPLLRPHRTNLDSFAWATGRAAIGVFDGTQPGPVHILWATGRPML